VDNSSESDEQGSAGDRGQGGAFPAARAAVVLVAFVVTTVLVLGVIHPTRVTTASGPTTTTATTTANPTGHHPSTTTTSSTHPPSTVPVLVANASGVSGAAGTVTSQLQVGGWNMQPPVNATARVATSHVYYVAGQQSAATAIATALHLPTSAVAPYTTAAPVSSIGTAEVVVVVGPDLASPSATTTTVS
jgi:hypothetical protein